MLKLNPLIFWFVLFFLFNSYSKENMLTSDSISSGIYWNEGATIAFDGHQLTGYIDNQAGENGRFTCQFYFSGQVIGRAFDVVCRNFIDTNIVSGKVTIITPTKFFLKTFNNPGCSDMIASFEEKGDTISLNTPSKIKQIRIVKSEKAFFYSSSDLKTKKKAYLVKGNQAYVYELQQGWLKVTYGKISGWMHEDDMFLIGH